MSESLQHGFATRAIHLGYDPLDEQGAAFFGSAAGSPEVRGQCATAVTSGRLGSGFARHVVQLSTQTATDDAVRGYLAAWTQQNAIAVFNQVWGQSVSLADYERTYGELWAVAPRILELLGSGAPDAGAARAMGVSLRTYRRRVDDLMATLGASSRFQAGARARELGLL